jgi:SET domain-containing protein
MDSANGLQIRGSRIHGLGVFAVQAIPAHLQVLEYVGKRLTKAESATRCDYTYFFHLDDEHDLDGAAGWNPAGFVNHSCEPNCDSASIDGVIWIVTQRDIADGEELTINYGYDLTGYLKRPCHCGAPSCVGFMVAEKHFPLVRSSRENQSSSHADA